MMDQNLSFDQIRQIMALQAATQPQTTSAATAAAFMPQTLPEPSVLQELLLQQQLQQHQQQQQQQQQLAAFAAATNQSQQSAFRRPHSQQSGSAAAFAPATTQPSTLLPFMVPTTTGAAASADFFTQYQMNQLLSQMMQPQPQQSIQQQQQQQNFFLQQLMMLQAQQLFTAQNQHQNEPMQVSSAAPTTASSPQLSTSPVVPMRKRAHTTYTRPAPKVAPKPKQKHSVQHTVQQAVAEHSVLRSLCEESDDEDNANRPNSAPHGAGKKRAVDPNSPDRHHPKNLSPSNPDIRLMESQVAMFLMGGGHFTMDMDSVLSEGLTSDDSPSKTSTDSGYTSRSASNGGNSAPAVLECEGMSEDIQVIYEKFKDDQNVPRLEALVFPSRSLASSPNGRHEMRDRISSVSLPRPVFDKLVDNVLNTCLA